MKTDEKIILHNVTGIMRHSGTDQQGNQWTEFNVDYFADQTAGECSICGESLEYGWMCLDGGEEVCASHVEIKELEIENVY